MFFLLETFCHISSVTRIYLNRLCCILLLDGRERNVLDKNIIGQALGCHVWPKKRLKIENLTTELSTMYSNGWVKYKHSENVSIYRPTPLLRVSGGQCENNPVDLSSSRKLCCVFTYFLLFSS